MRVLASAINNTLTRACGPGGSHSFFDQGLKIGFIHRRYPVLGIVRPALLLRMRGTLLLYHGIGVRALIQLVGVGRVLVPADAVF
jgi:hypothetical protein